MKYIDLIEYPTIGEVVFPDEPNEVYINRYALPRFRRNRQVFFDIVSHNKTNILPFRKPALGLQHTPGQKNSVH